MCTQRVVACLDPSAAVVRTAAIPGRAPVGWETAWDLGRDAALAFAWKTVAKVTPPGGATWGASPDHAWLVARSALRQAAAPILAALDASAALVLEGGPR